MTERGHVIERRWSFAALATTAGIAALLLAPGLASAQSIGGTVTDTTGSVLPGVTVEVRSPAIIEQVRTAVTDGRGQYLVIALEPGTFSVRYTLAGFGVIVREGIELSTGFTATVDIQLSVGSVEETVTVTGASPVVDIQNVAQRHVVDREVIDSVPTGKSFQAYALLVPGMGGSKPFGTTLNQDAGGITAQSYQSLGIHGGTNEDMETSINGMEVSEASTRGQHYGLIADGNYEEISIEYSAHSAEVETGGVRVNMIPREGANQFSGAFVTNFTFPGLQSDNVDQDLTDRGLAGGHIVDEVWLVNPSLGGPIVRDRLWFFVGHTTQRADVFPANTFKNQDPTAFVYAPDLSQPSLDENLTREQSLHLTWQATSKDKVKLFWSGAWTDKPHALQGDVLGSLFIAPEAALSIINRSHSYQATWVRPQTNRLLFEFGVSLHRGDHKTLQTDEAATTIPAILDVPDLVASRNMQGWLSATSLENFRNTDGFRGSVSYVTGSHNLKVGISGVFVYTDHRTVSDSDWIDVLTLNGAPLFANFRTPSRTAINQGSSLGIYAQDQWTLDRLTVNAGVRFGRINNSYPDQVLPGTTWRPDPFLVQANTAAIWKDLQPRLGVAYDLLGDGRTAVKASASRYGQRDAQNWAAALNPASTNALERRFWVDLNGDQFPQGDPLNPLPNGELFTPTSNPAFGTPIINTFYDEPWAFGWGNRFSNWELTGSVQQELMPGVSLDVGYFRRAFVNFNELDNRAVGPDDFDQYTLIAPTDQRIPGGGGNAVTLVDINPAAFGRLADNLTTHADNFGGETRTWNGVDVTVDARVEGVLLQGGVSTGKTAADFCALQSQLPEILPDRAGRGDTVPVDFCQSDTNWLTQVKFLGSYTLPYEIQIAGTYQSLPGPQRGAEVTFSAEEVFASLGRPLSGGGSVSADVLEPGTAYGERFHQVDLRFTKIISLGGTVRLRAMFDLFNVLNANAVTVENYGVGTNYLVPTAIMPGRLAKFAFQFDF